MALLLNIDTATEIASVCVSQNGLSLGLLKNEHQKEHASFVHAAVAKVLQEAGKVLKEIDAFAVTSGPGSYTGLRVGMASAKGFSYALSKPLITVNTLEVMARAAIDFLGGHVGETLLCPMIDARRMEVFTAIYTSSLKTVFSPQPLVLAQNIFEGYLKDRKIIFFGNGSPKFQQIEKSPNSKFMNISYDAKDLGYAAEERFNGKLFSDISYAQPDYFKEFQFAKKG